jgi:hypothetical protein
MANDQGAERDGVAGGESKTKTRDPRDTDHPTGTEQAAENAANESPS